MESLSESVNYRPISFSALCKCCFTIFSGSLQEIMTNSDKIEYFFMLISFFHLKDLHYTADPVLDTMIGRYFGISNTRIIPAAAKIK